MYEDFASQLAEVLTGYSTPIQPGDYVAIMGSVQAEPALRALYEAVVRRGGNPFVLPTLPGLNEVYFRHANADQLDFCDPVVFQMMERIDVLFQVMAPDNTKSLSNVDPARIARKQAANRPITEAYFNRSDDGSLRWTLTAWPTQNAAQEAGMGLLAYTEFVYNACGFDQDDPIAYWQARKDEQQRFVDWLKGKRTATITGPGIELTFRFDDRLWVNDWGNHNFPSGEIFTSPLEDTVEGHVAFNFPTMYGGREINGVKLAFEAGKVVAASATKGEDYLLSQLDMDDGARYLGEFAIGTNFGIQEFTGSTLFDEKIGGTIHMALGKALAEAGGTNDSAIHWDMVHNMKQGGEIHIDGDLVYQNGQFMIA